MFLTLMYAVYSIAWLPYCCLGVRILASNISACKPLDICKLGLVIKYVDQSFLGVPPLMFWGPLVGSREIVASAAAESVVGRHAWCGGGCWKWRGC